MTKPETGIRRASHTLGRVADPGRRCPPAGVRPHPAAVGGAGQDQGPHQVIRRGGHRIRAPKPLCHPQPAWRCWPFWVRASAQSTGGVTKWRVGSITTSEGKPARGLTRQASPVRWRRSAGGRFAAPSRGPNAAGEPATRPGRHDYSPNLCLPPGEPRHVGIAELLRLVGAVRRPPRAVLVHHDVGGALSVRPERHSSFISS
jgi:hypothetical protein